MSINSFGGNIRMHNLHNDLPVRCYPTTDTPLCTVCTLYVSYIVVPYIQHTYTGGMYRYDTIKSCAFPDREYDFKLVRRSEEE